MNQETDETKPKNEKSFSFIDPEKSLVIWDFIEGG